jgi:MGT family glycosyltransferase
VRVAFFTLPIQGHTGPALPIVTELVRRGAAVHAFSAGRFVAALAAVGAATTEYPSALAGEVEALSANFLVVAALLGRLAESSLLEWSIEALRADRPDVVLVDSMAPWGRLAAEHLGLPVVTSTSSFVVHPGLGASPRGLADLARRLPAGGRALGSIARTRRAVQRRYGVDPGGPIRLLSNRGDATIAYTSQALQPGGARLARSVAFVGPTLDPASDGQHTDDPFLATLGDGPLTYVSLGTMYNDRAPFLRACIDALAGEGRTVVIATGDRVSPAALGPLPPGVHAIPYAPQLALLARAELFITHAGLNSVHEALWHGVPMLAFPQAADQPVVAARIQKLGAGRVLRGREPSAAHLRDAARELLHDGVAQSRAEALGRGLRSGGGARRAAEVIVGADR